MPKHLLILVSKLLRIVLEKSNKMFRLLMYLVTNTASKPAVIEFANAECGCTTPVYSKDPILKGKSSTIKVTYNAVASGTFKKNVNIKFANSSLPIVLTIEGEVVPAKSK